MALQSARFSIDLIGPDISLEGFTQGETWNGWACPYFTFEQGQRVVESLNRADIEERKHEPTFDTFTGHYDAERDAFVFFYRSQQNSSNPDEDWDIFPSLPIDGQKYYAIGAGSWIWEEETEKLIA